jgi:DNA repair protein RecO (recombination protein O)
LKSSITGYILQVSPYKERQAALLVLTPQGKQSIFVANAQPKHSASIASLSRGAYSTFHFQEKKGKMAFSEAVLLSHPLSTLTSIHALLGLEVLLELTIKYVQEEEASPYFTPFHQAVQTLGHQPLVALNEYYRFLVERNGIPLTLDACVRCHAKKGIYTLSIQEGGFLCKKCVGESIVDKVPVDQLAFIRDFYRHGPRLGIHHDALLRLLKMHHDHALYAFNIRLTSYENFLTLF